MRALLEIVEKIADSIRLVMGLVVMITTVLGLMLSGASAYIFPGAAESASGHGKRVGEKAIAAHERRRIAEDMTKDGWSYGAATAASGHSAGLGSDMQPAKNGWAD